MEVVIVVDQVMWMSECVYMCIHVYKIDGREKKEKKTLVR